EFRYSGTILDLDTTGEFSTIGIESPDHGMGIEYLFTAYYDDGAAPIDGGSAIKFSTNCGSALLTGNVDLEGDVPTSAIVSTDLGQIARPNMHGDWRLLELPAGDYVLTCTAPYHFPQSESLSLVADEHAIVDYALNHIPTPVGLEVSQGDIDEITISWPSAPSAEMAFTSYRLLKFNAPGGAPEIIETSDTFYIDGSAETGRKYFYRVQFDYSNYLSLPSEIEEGWRELSTSVDEADLPKELSIATSPNPFNAVLRIEIEVPEGENGRLEIFDVLGRRVYEVSAITGRNAIDWKGGHAGEDMPSGIYFVRISTETKAITKRAVLIK
ncbi:MAG: T9SS type A sorting domain-containing protein, partial [bacterium]